MLSKDVLRFGAGIKPEDLILTRVPGMADMDSYYADPVEGGSLLIQIAGTDDSIQIYKQFYTSPVYTGGTDSGGIERFEFADGTVLTRSQLEARLTINPGTSGNEEIYGAGGADRLEGKGGDDLLIGEDGNDTYVYNAGDGNDIIREGWKSEIGNGFTTEQIAGNQISNDTLALGLGIDPSELIFTRPDAWGEDLVITFANHPGSITIEGQFRNTFHLPINSNGSKVTFYYGTELTAIDNIRFADGTEWNRDDIYARSMRATAGDDVIDGFFRPNETLNGGAGNDLLIGRNGDDQYVFGTGYGNDTVKEFAWYKFDGNLFSPGAVCKAADSITFVDVASTGVTTAIGAGGSFVFTILSTGETLTITSESEFANFTAIRFTDTIWDATAFQSRWTVLAGTAGDDVINGFINVDTISGGDGNDVLQGNQGADTLDGGLGNDVLTIEANDGDTAQGGDGDDMLAGGEGDDTFSVSGTGDGFDAVSGGGGYDTIIASGSYSRIGLTSLVGVEAISGGSGVYISGSSAANTLDFTNVVLTLITRIDGGSGNDIIIGSAANDVIQGSAGDDSLNGGLGNDVFQYTGSSSGFDLVNGGAGTNSIIALANSTVIGLSGLSKVQSISAGSYTNMSIAGSSNADTLNFMSVALSGITKIDAGAGNDVITGTNLADTILGSGGDDNLTGADGDDVFQYTGSSNGFDTVSGGAGSDIISALAASTVIGLTALSGVETISANGFAGVTVGGSANADTLDLSSVILTGIASINGNAGNDVITGSAAADTILGGADNDTLSGGLGDDVLNGGIGTNSLDGGDGTDVAQYSGTAGSYSVTLNRDGSYGLVGAGVNDTLVNIENLGFSDGTVAIASRVGLGLMLTGTSAAETLSGGGNNDTITGLGGGDTLNGNGGDDLFRVTGSADGFDIVDGGFGNDTITATANNAVIGLTSLAGVEAITAGGFTGVSIVGSSTANTLDFSSVTLTGITKIDGGAGNDTITGSGVADTILGSGGDDTINAGSGNDTIQFTGTSNGFDAVDGADGTDTIAALANSTIIGLRSLTGVETISAGSFTGVSIAGSANADALDFSTSTLTGITKIDLGAGTDTITGSAGAETILGSGGDDVINAGNGNDTIQYTGTSNGFDALDGGGGTDTISALANSTVIGLSSLAGVETISAGSFTGVYIAGSGNADTLNFLTNITRVEGGSGNDVITGNSAANTIWGGLGSDTLDGGTGNDTLLGDDGDDILKGGAGTDTINGGIGTDTLDYSAYTTNLTVNLTTTAAQTVTNGDSDTITNIENVTGGSGTDTLTGSTLANVINGGSGNDRLTGGAGNDSIIGGIGTSDVAVFAGLQASYTIATNAGVVTITDNQAATDGNDGVDTVRGIEKAEFKGGVQVGITSPIVLDLNGDGVSLVDNRASNVAYDWDGDGGADQTGWISRTDGFLVLDRNGDGVVSNGSELSFTSDKEGAKSDLDGLRAFDSNADGQFSADDEKFDQFRIWQDRNGDGRAGLGEMLSLEDAGVASINLGGEAVNRTWAWGENITINSGTFIRTNGTTGGFGDVALSDEVQRAAGNVLPGRGGRMPGYWNRFASIQKLAGSFADAIGRFEETSASDFLGRKENEAHRFEMCVPDRFLER